MKRHLALDARVFTLIGALALLPGCTTLGQFLGGTEQEEEIPPLPAPSIRRAVDPPVLSADQQTRQEEVNRYLARQYHENGWRIFDTVETYSGDIIDFLDPATVPGSEVEPPPPPEIDLPPGVELQMAEVEAFPELMGPSWSVPMLRPSFAPYVFGESEATSIEEFVENMVPGRPAGETRLYAGIVVGKDNTGAVSYVNQYGGSVEAATFSLLEMAVVCNGSNPSTTMELVGIAASRDAWNFDRSGNVHMRLQVEFMTAGESAAGGDKGGWHGNPRVAKVFVPRAGVPYPPGSALTPVSTVGGVQYESRFEIRNIKGDWWIAHNFNWLGHYPAHLFDEMVGGACQAHWYGEIFDKTPEDWTPTDMGSGRFAAEGLGSAANFRRPAYRDLSGVEQWPDNAVPAPQTDPACYTSSGLLTGGPQWERHMFVGGPGGDAPGCH